MQRKLLGLTRASVVHVAYQLDVRNGIKNQFLQEKSKDWKKVVANFPTTSSRNFSYNRRRSSLSKARGFTPESAAQVLETCS
jgi:hypothetical protein